MASYDPEVHHAAPRCLLTLHERANGTATLDGEAIQAWVEWELEAMRWRVPVEISQDDLRALVEVSEVVLEREVHRLVHEGDWRRWGARGGRETLRRVMNSGENCIEMRVPRSAWFLRDLRFPHS